jgi:archaellum biogenesis ATPase FlaH
MVIKEQQMTNSDFLVDTYGDLPEGQHGWVCSFRADPSNAPPAVWAGRLYKGTPQQAALIDRAGHDNTYFCTSVLTAGEGGEIARVKTAFVRLAVLVLDDVQPQDLQGYSYAIQTSPGKFQVGILIDLDDPDARNRQLVDALMQSLATRGFIKADRSGNNAVRYVRLPVGKNTKPRAAGEWAVALEFWNPSVRWSLEDACAAIGIDLDNIRATAELAISKATTTPGTGVHAGEMIAGLTAPVGERVYHDSITRLAASLVSNGMFPGAAVEFLRDLMHQVKPTGPEEEVRRWQSRYDEIERAVKSAEKFAPEERKPPSITVNLNLGNDEQVPTESKPGDLVPMDWGNLAGTQPEPTQWRLDGWLPEGTVTLLAANGGVGKSNLSLQLGVSLATGQQFMGIDTKQSRVLVLSGEDEARTVHFRVANICQDQGVAMRDLAGRMAVYDLTQADCVLWRDGHPTERMQWLADTAVRTRAEVIVIDNASDVFADNENDRTAVRGFMRALNLIAHVTRAAVLLLAHVDKASVRMGAGQDTNSTFSGSTAWNNSARSRWAMVRDGQVVTVRHEKCNLGPLQDELRVEFDQDSKTFKRFGTIPGHAAAAALMRNTQRAAILRLLVDSEKAGQRLSMSAQANNNAYTALRGSAQFPRLDRRDFFSMLFELQRDGLVTEEEYTRDNRGKAKRLALTEAGRLRAAQGSGAPAMWHGSPSVD